jgi:Na+(H+)/acetate symporter ActP
VTQSRRSTSIALRIIAALIMATLAFSRADVARADDNEAATPTGNSNYHASGDREVAPSNSWHKRPRRHGDDIPVAPVPEPGTMALASMGLVALGAVIRKARARKAS